MTESENTPFLYRVMCKTSWEEFADTTAISRQVVPLSFSVVLKDPPPSSVDCGEVIPRWCCCCCDDDDDDEVVVVEEGGPADTPAVVCVEEVVDAGD